MSKLFYVIGASGSGKDSILEFARTKVKGMNSIVFAHRYITRKPDPKSENSIYLTQQEFHARLRAGLFAMNWRSHQLYYGIGKEINYWMYQGCSVVVNGSREYLPTALEKYKNLQPILIEASPETIYERLKGRGRETEQEINSRIERNKNFSLNNDKLFTIRNEGTLEEAGYDFVDFMTENCKTEAIR